MRRWESAPASGISTYLLDSIERNKSKVFGKGEKKVLIENIPVIHCSNCRESYLLDATMRHLDEIRLNAKTLTTPATIRVAKIA